MLDGELNDTLRDYMNANCSNLLSNTEFRHGSIFYTHQKPKEYIAEGLPTLLVLQSYESSAGNSGNHVVLAYGYKDDKFLTHFGWWPGSTSRAEVILNSATIYGYLTIKYNGAHKHSSNVSMTNGSMTEYICGCGEVHQTAYSIEPNAWGFDERYYFDNEGLKTKALTINDLTVETERLRCGYIEDKYINLSANRYDADDAYLNLTFSKPIYKLDTNLSFWSSSEHLYSNQGDFAYVQYLDGDGNWVNSLDLLSCGLSTDRNNQNHYNLDFVNGTSSIRFIVHKKTPDTNRNKGRICIGQTKFVTTIKLKHSILVGKLVKIHNTIIVSPIPEDTANKYVNKVKQAKNIVDINEIDSNFAKHETNWF